MIPPAWILDPLAAVGACWLACRLLDWAYGLDTFDPLDKEEL